MEEFEQGRAPHRFDLAMHGYAENVHLVRQLVDQAVIAWQLTENVRQLGRLILTELATNAARIYEGASLRVWVSHSARSGILEMAVWDPDPHRLPVLLPLTEHGESGRGLALVYALSDQRLGWYPAKSIGGKVVWAQVGP